jgi:hypothetical protein
VVGHWGVCEVEAAEVLDCGGLIRKVINVSIVLF